MEKSLLLNISIKEEAEGGYSAVCTDLDVASQGETIKEAISNIKEAIELYLESAEELGITNEILGKLGLTRKEARKEEVIIPKIFRTEIPVSVAV